MRTARFSVTANDQFNELLAYGAEKYGPDFADAKKALVYNTIKQTLIHFPALKPIDENTGLRFYPISNTPFVVIYDFDDTELRIHFIMHTRADLNDLDPATVEW